MKAKKAGVWGVGNWQCTTYGFKTKSAAKRFMKSLGFTGRKVEDKGEELESHNYQRGKLEFGRFFPATYVEGFKYLAHVCHK
ncbi:hypothetical protein QNH09_gp17 [Aeromonas phage PVN03]|uniref:Uncharacterized protein n=1 Tax=Aeromonas phage PVN03 TaxID=2822864 RepID=A0AAE7UUA2_9CAUD|nr:hypothetical protein QNH09_gp17 [Aeromonas phage PVN03]QTQ06799.1 hypothetical protein [Aeromonas phage PVN03]